MAKLNAGQGRLARLLQLLLLLGSGRCPNARALAEACEVSRRTVYRDLEVLEMAGAPVLYRPDRQGYELAPGFCFAPPALEEAEAVALLVLARQWGEGDGLGLARAARSGARKLIQTLPPEVRDRARDLAELAGPEAEPGPSPPARCEVYEAILQSLGRRLQVRLWSLGEDGLTLETTKLSPYRLAFVRPDWRLVGRSSAHRAVRSFSVARVRRALLTDEPYEIPPRLDFDRLLGPGEAQGPPGGPPLEVLARVSGRAAPEVLERAGPQIQVVEVAEDGGSILRWPAASLDAALAWALELGDEVEILGPPELRARSALVAGRVARAHADPLPLPSAPRHARRRGPADREAAPVRGAGS